MSDDSDLYIDAEIHRALMHKDEVIDDQQEKINELRGALELMVNDTIGGSGYKYLLDSTLKHARQVLMDIPK